MTSSRCSKFCCSALVLSIIVVLNTWPGLADYLLVDENCDEQAVLFYEDIGCKPKHKTGKWCPIAFDCGNLTRLNDACRLAGKLYKLGDTADSLIQGQACQKSCTCRERPHAPAEFLCGILNCPEESDGPKLRPGCHKIYDLHKCCPSGTVCDGNIVTCNYNGRPHMNGEIIYLDEYCVKCNCQNGFSLDDSSTETRCARLKCGLELRHADKIEKYCAPAYVATAFEKICCPNAFICPSEADDVKDGVASRVGQCRFGNNTYNLGARFNRSMEVYSKMKHFKCECRLPPFFTCLENALSGLT